MFGYYPAYTYAPQPGYGPFDSGYARAVAEERAAQAQYAAALRAQEEARNRAARARLAKQAYAPYNSYLSEDSDEEYPPCYGYSSARGLTPQQRRALAELERERQIEAQRQHLERQRKQEEELQRQRILLEAQRRSEEEERQKQIAEYRERLRREQEERQNAMEQFYRNLGMRMPREHPETAARRARTVSPAGRRPQTQTPTQSPTPAAEPSEPIRIPIHEPAPLNNEERNAAAEKIQEVYRAYATRHKSLQTIADIHSRFQSLKSAFSFPQHVDYQGEDDSHISVDTSSLTLPTIPEEPSTPIDEDESSAPFAPKLAYNSHNAPIHQYDEELNRLLGKLDAVESGGDKTVREKRRDMVRAVEKEAQRVEAWKVAVWKAYQEAEASKPSVGEAPEDVTMEKEDETLEVASVEVESSEPTEQTPAPTEPEPLSALGELSHPHTLSASDSTPMDIEPTHSEPEPPHQEPTPMDVDPSSPHQPQPPQQQQESESPSPTPSPSLSATTADEPVIEDISASAVHLPPTEEDQAPEVVKAEEVDEGFASDEEEEEEEDLVNVESEVQQGSRSPIEKRSGDWVLCDA